jgi:iron complex outermembrane receptor protein
MRYENVTDPLCAIHVRGRLGAALLCGLLAMSAAPTGHTADAATGADATSSAEMTEITVTATRREESLSKVPISISAFTQESMDQKGVKDITDLVR